jgi:hypothetical protein
MRNLKIAYANSRDSKTWINKAISYEDLKNRLRIPIRTTETVQEYAKMNKPQRDAIKDHGGFVGGKLKNGIRQIKFVECRSLITLDGDQISRDFLERYEELIPYTNCLYTTHSHTPENPRVRLIFPLTRDINSEEYVLVLPILKQDFCEMLPEIAVSGQ